MVYLTESVSVWISLTQSVNVDVSPIKSNGQEISSIDWQELKNRFLSLFLWLQVVVVVGTMLALCKSECK